MTKAASRIADVASTPAVTPRAASRGATASLWEACKPGITRLVTITSGVGFVMAAVQRPWTVGQLAWLMAVTLVGTALSAAGANAINQWIERRRDALMHRTCRRPLPSGRLEPRTVLVAGVLLSVLGVLVLLAAGVLPAAIAAVCVLSYVLWYTPLKTRSTLATFVGAIPGGLPPLIGYSAAAGGRWESLFEPMGLALLAIMLIWQIPHFLAIAWMYREDYERGGYVMLPSIDEDGRWTSATMALWAWALVPATLLPVLFMPELLGGAYGVVALATGIAYAVLCVRLAITRERDHARQVFFASIMHLPVLLMTMVGEATLRTLLR